MNSPTRIHWLRAPLMAVIILLFALLALLPAAAIQAQSAGTAPPTSSGPLAVHPASAIDGEVSDMFVKGKSLEVRYRNTGSTATDILGEVQVRDQDNELVAAVPLVEGKRIDAGRKETFRVAMPSLPPGKYTIYAVVDFGGDTLTAAQAELEIRP